MLMVIINDWLIDWFKWCNTVLFCLQQWRNKTFLLTLWPKYSTIEMKHIMFHRHKNTECWLLKLLDQTVISAQCTSKYDFSKFYENMYFCAFTEVWAKPRIFTDPRTTPEFKRDYANAKRTHMLRSENHTYSAPWEVWVWPHEVRIV